MNALKSMLLDLRAGKVYWKNILFSFLIMAACMIASRSFLPIFFILIFFLTLPLWQYPFATFEKCAVLYYSLPMKKSDVVLGRYLLGGFSVVISILLGTAVGAFVSPKYFASGLIFLAESALALFIMLMMAIQAPVLFRYGYMKSRMFVMISLMIIPILGGALLPTIAKSRSEKTVEGIGAFVTQLIEKPVNPVIPVILLLVGAVALTISYHISLAVYQKKDI